MRLVSKFALALAVTTLFAGASHAQLAGNGGGGLIAAGQGAPALVTGPGGGGGLVAAGTGAPVPVAGPPPVRLPLGGPIAGVAAPVGTGLGGLSIGASIGLGLGAIVAVGAIAQGGGSAASTN